MHLAQVSALFSLWDRLQLFAILQFRLMRQEIDFFYCANFMLLCQKFLFFTFTSLWTESWRIYANISVYFHGGDLSLRLVAWLVFNWDSTLSLTLASTTDRYYFLDKKKLFFLVLLRFSHTTRARNESWNIFVEISSRDVNGILGCDLAMMRSFVSGFTNLVDELDRGKLKFSQIFRTERRSQWADTRFFLH